MSELAHALARSIESLVLGLRFQLLLAVGCCPWWLQMEYGIPWRGRQGFSLVVSLRLRCTKHDDNPGDISLLVQDGRGAISNGMRCPIPGYQHSMVR